MKKLSYLIVLSLLVLVACQQSAEIDAKITVLQVKASHFLDNSKIDKIGF
ncbi:hypothetical protein [Algoriphagus mannitolivorans]|nr:hypothetical protein [Algoriphagus mannitolivorans]